MDDFNLNRDDILSALRRNLEDFKLRLPWGRLDEVEISFALK